MRAWLKLTLIFGFLISIYFWSEHIDEFNVCGLNRSYSSGTVLQLRRDLIAEKDPHARPQPEFQLAWRPVIKPEGGDEREVVGQSERSPTERKAGDKVRFCYNQATPESVYLTR